MTTIPHLSLSSQIFLYFIKLIWLVNFHVYATIAYFVYSMDVNNTLCN